MRFNGHKRPPSKGCAVAILAIAGFSAPAFSAPAPVVSYAMDDSFRAGIEGTKASLMQGDASGAQQRAQALVSAADQPLEKYAAGELMLQAAAGRGDLRSQRAALNVILESGEVPPADTGRLRAMAGILSAILGDRKDAIAQIDYANGQGFASVTSQVALGDARFQRGDAAGGIKALDEAFALCVKDGKDAVEQSWYDRAIALAYKAKRFDMVARWTQAKLVLYPTAPNWRSGIINYITWSNVGPDQSLDLYRLMATTDAMASERDWLAYSTVAAQKGTAAEAKAALDIGVKAGDLNPADALVAKELAALKPKAAKALAEIPALTAKAKTGSGAAILTAADAQFAAAAFPTAVDLYRAALAKGDIDAGRAKTRLGIALARSGDLPGGKAMLASVTEGDWVPIAGFWSTWTDRKIVRNPE